MKALKHRLLCPAVIIVAVVNLASCAPELRETSNPVPTEWHRLSGAPPGQTTLLVLLPGKRSQLADFSRNGFIDSIRQEDRIDAVAVDLHFGYYRERNLDLRLREDVIEPALEKGYRRIEMVGISLGGLGALIYAFERPGEIDRLTLLAPYVGDDPIREEIEAAGGLAEWEPGPVDDSDFQRRLWKELKAWIPSAKSSSAPDIRIGVGKKDRHRVGNEFFSRELLNGRISLQPGGHDWASWKPLYEQFFQLKPSS